MEAEKECVEVMQVSELKEESAGGCSLRHSLHLPLLASRGQQNREQIFRTLESLGKHGV